MLLQWALDHKSIYITSFPEQLWWSGHSLKPYNKQRLPFVSNENVDLNICSLRHLSLLISILIYMFVWPFVSLVLYCTFWSNEARSPSLRLASHAGSVHVVTILLCFTMAFGANQAPVFRMWITAPCISGCGHVFNP